jgi:hypothetical protein
MMVYSLAHPEELGFEDDPERAMVTDFGQGVLHGAMDGYDGDVKYQKQWIDKTDA